jgi:uncharacterized DUF497 family protein
MRFEWDDTKARRNLREHGVSFEEAASVFGDPLALEIRDPRHSQLEERYIAMGYSLLGRLLVVVHSEEAETLRIISARIATRHEREAYEKGTV